MLAIFLSTSHEELSAEDWTVPGIVALVEVVEVVQHGGVIEHVVHDLMAQQAAELPDQLEGELVGGVYLPPPRLPLRLLPLLGELLPLHQPGLDHSNKKLAMWYNDKSTIVAVISDE